jgi:hypothetical protein
MSPWQFSKGLHLMKVPTGIKFANLFVFCSLFERLYVVMAFTPGNCGEGWAVQIKNFCIIFFLTPYWDSSATRTSAYPELTYVDLFHLILLKSYWPAL